MNTTQPTNADVILIATESVTNQISSAETYTRMRRCSRQGFSVKCNFLRSKWVLSGLQFINFYLPRQPVTWKKTGFLYYYFCLGTFDWVIPKMKDVLFSRFHSAGQTGIFSQFSSTITDVPVVMYLEIVFDFERSWSGLTSPATVDRMPAVIL